MNAEEIPQLSEREINDCLLLASASVRRRHPKILHGPGDEFNRVFNFIMQDSYMQPHLHPGDEKIEKMYLIRGRMAVILFDNQGSMKSCSILDSEGIGVIEVPAFTWHTYVMLSDYVISYETMMGKYVAETWKKLANWAPPEGSLEALAYLDFLKAEAVMKVSEV